MLRKYCGSSSQKTSNFPVLSAMQSLISLTEHQKTIEGLANAWPTGVEVSSMKLKERVFDVLKQQGWGEGVGDRQFRNWIEMIAPTIPPRKKHYGRTAFRELLYLGYWMHSGEGYKDGYLHERKWRLKP